MLADIERLQMEAVRPHLQDQRINQRLRQPGTTVLDQAGMQNLQIRREIPAPTCRQAEPASAASSAAAFMAPPTPARRTRMQLRNRRYDSNSIALSESLLARWY